MAYASVTYTSASGTTFALTNSSGDPIQYIKQSDIAVYVNNTLQTLTTDYTFNSAGTAIVLNVAVSGATVLIQRTTDISSPTVIYTAGSTLTAQDLNNADNQLRYGLQEFRDFVNTGGGVPDGDKGDITVAGNSTIWTIDNGAITSAKIANDTIVNADINSAAAIAHSKLANITAGQILLGNSSNVPTATALSGDVTIDSSGVTAIGSGVVVDADINASAAIAGTKIQAATTSNAGAVQLTDSISSTSTTTAATPNSVKTSYDLANAAMPKSGGTFTGDITSTTVKVTNLQHASAASPAIVLASDGTATAQLSSLNGGPLAGARNRIINGDMRIDQRNAGASVTPSNQYVLDRWYYGNSQASKGTIQQNAGSVTPPTGFDNYLGFVSSSAYSVLSADEFFIRQAVEGFNFSDFAFGTASAKSCTISFWVRSSLTGTFGAVLKNSASLRSYPFTYTISAANTWEYKTQTIAGDTTGTWIGGTNGVGAYLVFALGAGSTRSGTAGAWAGVDVNSATGATSVVGTNGATFYITGVQLEAGSVATPFERRSYGQELALCQRYFMSLGAVVPTTSAMLFFPVITRAVPTITGGGSGYSAPNVFTNGLLHSQTTANVQTLSVSAEL